MPFIKNFSALQSVCLRRAHFWTPKSGRKNRWGDLAQATFSWPSANSPCQTPVVCLIGLYQGRYRAATEILPGRWPLVIGAGGYGLRLTALVLRDISFFACKNRSVSHRRMQFVIELSCICPFKRASAEAGPDTRHRPDPRRNWWFSGSAAARLIQTDWTTAGVQPEEGWRFFGSLLCVQK